MDSEPGRSDPTSPRLADGPRPATDLALAEQVEPVFHTVAANENFWTISRDYYGSTRYYKALHAANQRQVPNIARLYIGTVIQIPPIEKLDRALIDRETASVKKTTRQANPDDFRDFASPVRPRMTLPDPEAVETRPRPTYRVKPNDTLRSIARETLNNSRRDMEIYDLNREVLDDPRDLPPGTILTLPEGARVSRVIK